MPLGRTGRTGRTGRALHAVTILVSVLLLVVTGCTTSTPDDEASPSPSTTPSDESVADDGPGEAAQQIAVIVPPPEMVAPAEAAALGRAAEALAEEPPAGVTDVRVARAATPAFVRDLANLAVDDGYDVVCVVGTGTAELALELARQRRSTRICTTDGRIAGGPVNLVAVALDPAALVEAGAVAIGTAQAPVGLLLSPQLGDAEVLTAAFTSTVAPPRQTVAPSPSPAPSPPTGDAATAEPSPPQQAPRAAFSTVTAGSGTTAQANAGEELAAAGPSRALVLATPGGTEAVRAVATAGVEVVGVSDWIVDAEGQLPPSTLVALTVDWGRLLDEAVAAARTPDAPQVQLQGVDAGIIGALPGQAPEGADAAERTTQHLQRSAG